MSEEPEEVHHGHDHDCDAGSEPRRLMLQDVGARPDQGTRHGLAPGVAPDAKWRLHAPLLLTYVGDDGRRSRRTVTVKKLLGRDEGGAGFIPVALLAECPPARKPRLFLFERIVETAVPDTGEIIRGFRDLDSYIELSTFAHTSGRPIEELLALVAERASTLEASLGTTMDLSLPTQCSSCNIPMQPVPTPPDLSDRDGDSRTRTFYCPRCGTVVTQRFTRAR